MVLKERNPKSSEPKSKRNYDKLMALAGAWKDIDTEKIKRELKRRRRMGTGTRSRSS
jgi:predicted CopG family antitoxin